MALAAPKRRRRRKLIIILSRLVDWYGLLMLCQIWEIYEKTDETLTNPEKDVVQAVDTYYLAYDSEDDENFDECCVEEDLDQNTKGTVADALESAINNL